MLRHALIALQTLLSTPLRARRAARTDAQLAAAYTALTTTKQTDNPAAQTFPALLQGYLKNPESWSCRFPQARAAGLNIHTSTDGRLRSFSWQHQHQSHTLLQSRSPNGHTHIHPDLIPGGQIERLHTTRLPAHGTAYLLLAEHHSEHETEKSLHLLHFAHNQLQPLPIIQTAPAAEPTHRLQFSYSGQSANNYFFYEPGSHTISQPQISPHTHTPTQHRLKYRLNGTLFLPHR